MSEKQDPVPAVIMAAAGLYSGAKAGALVGSLVGPAGAAICAVIGAIVGHNYNMRQLEQSKNPYEHVTKTLVAVGLQLLPDATAELALLPDTTVASQPAAPHRMSLLERIAAGQGAPPSPALTFRGELS